MEKHPIHARNYGQRIAALALILTIIPELVRAGTAAASDGVAGEGSEFFVRSYFMQGAGLAVFFTLAAGFCGWKLVRSGKVRNS